MDQLTINELKKIIDDSDIRVERVAAREELEKRKESEIAKKNQEMKVISRELLNAKFYNEQYQEIIKSNENLLAEIADRKKSIENKREIKFKQGATSFRNTKIICYADDPLIPTKLDLNTSFSYVDVNHIDALIKHHSGEINTFLDLNRPNTKSNIFVTLTPMLKVNGLDKTASSLAIGFNQDWEMRFLNSIHTFIHRVRKGEEYDANSVISNQVHTIVNISCWLNLSIHLLNDLNIPEILEQSDFKVYTSNKTTIPCLEQCIRKYDALHNTYIWDAVQFYVKPDMHDKEIYELLIQHVNVCIYHTDNKKELKDYKLKDLKLSFGHANGINMDLLNHKGHLCLIYDKVVQDTYRIKKRLVSKQIKDLSEVYFDFETFINPESNSHTPYLVCFTFNDEDHVYSRHGENCAIEMLQEIYTFGKKEIRMMAYNGSGFDFQILIGEVIKRQFSLYDANNNRLKIEISNIQGSVGKITTCDLMYGDMKIQFLDPRLFVLGSLRNVAKSYGCDNLKGDFPYEIVSDYESLNKVLPEWKIYQDGEITMDKIRNDEKQVTIRRTQIETGTGEYNVKILDKAIEYCALDVLVLREVWQKFKQSVNTMFMTAYQLKNNMFTLAQLAYDLYLTTIAKNVGFETPFTSVEYKHFRSAMYGGRCVSLNGVYTEPCVLLDVKSLYPAAEKFYDHPYGKYAFNVGHLDWKQEKLGIYEAELTIGKPTVMKSNSFVPYRDENKKLQFGPTETHKGWYTTYDLLIAEEEGYFITIHSGYVWKNKGRIFDNYVDTLFSLKSKYDQGADPVKYMVVKILLNSLWGKMAQKATQRKLNVIYDFEIDEFPDSEIVPCLTEHMYLCYTENESNSIYSKPTQNGCFVLSAARYHMKKIWNQVVKCNPNAYQLYSDTDSILLFKKFVPDALEYLICGKEIGMLEHEIQNEDHVTSNVIILGKKMYLIEYLKDNLELCYKMRMKGVSNNYLHPNIYKHLIVDKNNVAKFTVMQYRKYFDHITYNTLDKHIKQT